MGGTAFRLGLALRGAGKSYDENLALDNRKVMGLHLRKVR